MRLRENLASLRSDILAVAAENGARNVRLFGSIARGEETPASDIDLLVTMDEGRTLMDIVRLENRLERLTGRRVDISTEQGLREPIRTTAIREAVIV